MKKSEKKHLTISSKKCHQLKNISSDFYLHTLSIFSHDNYYHYPPWKFVLPEQIWLARKKKKIYTYSIYICKTLDYGISCLNNVSIDRLSFWLGIVVPGIIQWNYHQHKCMQITFSMAELFLFLWHLNCVWNKLTVVLPR